MEEFDLRLDEGMVQWAQGLAERVLWDLVANRRVNEMGTWSLPEEAFCSLQVRFMEMRSSVFNGHERFINKGYSFEHLCLCFRGGGAYSPAYKVTVLPVVGEANDRD